MTAVLLITVLGCNGTATSTPAATVDRANPSHSADQLFGSGLQRLSESPVTKRSFVERETGLKAPSGKTRVEFTYRLTAGS